MDSPVSAIVASLYMEFFEELALATAPVRPKVWKRYVDDTFYVMKKGNVERLLDHLNRVHPIQFTCKLEKDMAPYLFWTSASLKCNTTMD